MRTLLLILTFGWILTVIFLVVLINYVFKFEDRVDKLIDVMDDFFESSKESLHILEQKGYDDEFEEIVHEELWDI
jgi:hypothetical protein